MRIQYVSDLHLDLRPVKFRRIIKPSADVLILAGDIGNPFRKTFEYFLRWCNNRFLHVIFVPGNQEYHGSSLKAAKKKMKQICKDIGVIFLDRGKCLLPEYELCILGTTLWTEIPHDKSFDVLYTIDDYSSIRGFDLYVINEIHSRDKKWLAEALASTNKEFPEYKTIVVTHHAPILKKTSAPRHRHSSNLCAYASDCRDIIDNADIDIWVFGHTHYNTTFRHKNTILTSNQRGEARETSGYQKDCIISF